MDVRLKAYRSQKSREEVINRTKSKLKSLFERMLPSVSEESEVNKQVPVDVSCEILSDTSSVFEDQEELCTKDTWAKLTLYGSLWVALFILAIYAEFGAVYFVISLLCIIWKNTRTGPKRAGEVSAYSVFNPNCEAIHGTLKGEQLEREIRYGGLL